MAALNMYDQAILQGYGVKIFQRMADMFRGLQMIRGYEYTHVVMPFPYRKECLLHQILLDEMFKEAKRGNAIAPTPRINDNLVLHGLTILWFDAERSGGCPTRWLSLSRTDVDSLFEGVPTEKEYLREVQKMMNQRNMSAVLQQDALRQQSLNQQQALYGSSLQAQMGLNQQQQAMNAQLNAQLYAQQSAFTNQDMYRLMELNRQWDQEQNRMKPRPVTRDMFPHLVAEKEIPKVGWVKVIKIPSSIQNGERFEIQFIPWVDPQKTGGRMSYQQYKWYQRKPKPFLTPVFSPLKTMLYTAIWTAGLTGVAWVGVKLSPLVESFFEQVVLP